MKKGKKNYIYFGILLLVFIAFTLLIKNVDVQAIGPENSEVGLATINDAFHGIFNYNELLYKISKYLGYISFLIIGLYGIKGLIQLIKEKNLFKVDKKLLILGGFYVVVLLVYILFEFVIINYRPVLEDGVLEASYPSSHTILSICVCASSLMISKNIFKKEKFVKILNVCTYILMFGIIITRVLSGVHWLTDIVGAILISLALCNLFKGSISLTDN